MSNFRRPTAGLPGNGMECCSSTVPSFPPSRREDTPVPQKWAAAFGIAEAGNSHGLMRREKTEISGRGCRVRLPNVEEWVSRKAALAPNYAFFNDPIAKTGLEEGMWPRELAENLRNEDLLVESLIGGGAREGAYLKLGCKNGSDLAVACGAFSTVYAMDISIEMLKASARIVADRLGQQGVDKLVLIRGDMADDIRPIRSQTIDFAMCGFNHFGNLGEDRQILFLRQVNRFMKHSISGADKRDVFPLVLTIYKEHEKTRRMQEEFYRNMGLELTTTIEDETQGIVSARSPRGKVLKSERFDPDKIRRIIAKANSALLETPIRVFQHIDLSDTMMALVIYAQRTIIDEVSEGTNKEDLDAPL